MENRVASMTEQIGWLIHRIDRISKSVDRQDLISTIDEIRYFSSNLMQTIQRLLDWQQDDLKNMFHPELLADPLQQMFEAQRNEDYILYADLLVIHVLPVLQDILNLLQSAGDGSIGDYWEQNMEGVRRKDAELYRCLQQCEKLHDSSVYRNDVYSLEKTLSGDLTVCVSDREKKRYLHSVRNPVMSAEKMVDEYYDANRDSYVIYGLGMGYHCRELAGRDEDLDITIIENDIGIIQLAMTYMDMGWYCDHPGIRLVYDADWGELLRQLQRGKQPVFLFHRPSVRRIRNSEMLERIEQMWVKEDSAKVYGDKLLRNFRFNIEHCVSDLGMVKSSIEGKTAVIIAGGPSLDKNVGLLKEKPQDAVYLAVGAVYRKMSMLEIPIDYVIVTDPKNESVHQVDGMEESEVPLLILSTAEKGIARKCHARKYLLCQRGFEPAEKYAGDHFLELFDTGGSVATAAVDLSLHFGAARLVFVGLDLAFTGKKAHASLAGEQDADDILDNVLVEDVNGQMIAANRSFVMYREWIERRIENAGVQVIDATEGGANIRGAENCSLRDVLNRI